MEVDLKKSWAEERQDIINAYLIAHPGVVDWNMEDVASWAIRKALWHPPFQSAIQLCAGELSRAARVEFHTDPQGRRVRSKYPRREKVMVDGKPKQLVFWEDQRNLEPNHMRVSLQQRRNGILSVCAQTKRDTDSYNDNNIHGAHIQMSFDFTEDLLDLEAPEDYPESADEDVDQGSTD